jgi:hypothetical protein
MGKVTDRLYESAQRDFRTWCRRSNLNDLPSVDGIARYLQFCLENHGPSATVMRTSAIAKLYREHGRSFDTRFEPIQQVLMLARAQMGKSASLKRKPKTVKRS